VRAADSAASVVGVQNDRLEGLLAQPVRRQPRVAEHRPRPVPGPAEVQLHRGAAGSGPRQCAIALGSGPGCPATCGETSHHSSPPQYDTPQLVQRFPVHVSRTLRAWLRPVGLARRRCALEAGRESRHESGRQCPDLLFRRSMEPVLLVCCSPELQVRIRQISGKDVIVRYRPVSA
jgi:hypothetical protein